MTGTVFGILRNFGNDVFLLPWLTSICGRGFSDGKWLYSFWEEQPLPAVPGEGHSHIDLVIASSADLVFVEAKLAAVASQRTKNDSERDQITRNLDVGYARASRDGQRFEFVYLTADDEQPPEIGALRRNPKPYKANMGADPEKITACLHWSSWADIGNRLAHSYSTGILNATEQLFARDVLAYLVKKGLWRGSLTDETDFYEDKLWRPLQASGDRFAPFKSRRHDQDNSWRRNPWVSTDELRTVIVGLPMKCKALLKIMADASGPILQRDIMAKLRFLRGDSAVLRRVKAQINGACKQAGKMPILAEGYGDSGERRVHDFNPDLGVLRQVVVTTAANFEIPWSVLDI